MNKLLLGEKNVTLNEGEYEIDYQKDVIIDVKDKVVIHNYHYNNKNVIINLDNNSILDFYNFYVVTESFDIFINTLDNAILNYNLLIINNGKNKIHINVNMNGNNSSVSLKVHILNINDTSNIDVICDGLIKKSIDNELVEDLKGLIVNKDKIKISPNMEVYTDLVSANHLVTVGSFNKEELFYLISKGLSEKNAKKVIVESFINSVLSSVLRDYVNMEVINIE